VPAYIDGGALDQAVGRWVADRRPKTSVLRALAMDGRACAALPGPKDGRSTFLPNTTDAVFA
jgi:hypothetical protein